MKKALCILFLVACPALDFAQNTKVNAAVQVQGTLPTSSLPGSGATTVNGVTCTIGSTCAVTGATATYTTSHTAVIGDNSELILMNCSSACSLTLPSTQPSSTWYARVMTIGSTNATIVLGGSDTFNGTTSVPVLVKWRPITVYANTNTSTDYEGEAPLVAGTNMTFTPAANGLTIASTGGGGGVSSITGDSTIISNSGSTGAVTLTLANAAAGTVLGNATSSAAAPTYTHTPQLGASGTLGSVTFGNATSGLLTLQTVTGALGSVTASLPANTGTIGELNLAQTWSALQTFGTNISIGGVTATGAQGTGNVVFATSPTLTTPNIGAATGTSLSVTGQLTSTVATGTAPLVVSSTTNVANLNASSLGGATFAAPGSIGSTTAGSGAFTTLSASSTVSGTGFSTYLASPPAIGGTSAAAGSFTTLSSSGGVTNSKAGAASTAAELLSGAPFTGGTGTTTYPLDYFNDGTAPTTWSTNGTEFGINAPSGFSGNFLDFHVNGGASVFSVTAAGALTVSSCSGCGGGISGLTTGVIPQAGSATTLVNSSPQLDNGVTTANTLTYAGTGGIAAPSFTSSGTCSVSGSGSGLGCLQFSQAALPSTGVASETIVYGGTTGLSQSVGTGSPIGIPGVGACGSNQFETTDNIAAAPTCVQPALGGITATFSAPLSLSTNTLSVNNATNSAVGVVQLTGDLGGTATSPTVVGGSHITNGSIANSGLANSSVTINTQATSLGNSWLEYAAGGGTAQAQTVTLSPAAGSLTAGLNVYWLPTAANTASGPTLAVSGLTAKTITKCGTTALSASDLTTLAVAHAIYDGTEFQLLNPQAATCGGGAAGVTSFTGDGHIITNSASTGGVALTIAGTSGGVPYFSSSSAWQSSGALTQYGVVLGGGAGAAPTATSAGALGTFLSGQGSANPSFIALSAINAQTATYQVLASDFQGYKTISVGSGTFTVTLVASGSQPANGQYIRVLNYGTGTVTVARSGQNINGGTASITLNPGSASAPTSALIESDGTNYFASIDEGTVGTVTSIATTGPISGGTITSTGTISCPTCATTTSGGALSGTAPIAISAGGAISITGVAGEVLAGSTPAFTATPALGTDGSVAGTLQLSNSAAAFHTILGSAATANNTVDLFATAPTTGDAVKCVTASTTCTLTDAGGPIPSSLANASHKWLNSYTQSSGAFTQTQPADTDLTGTTAGAELYVSSGAVAELSTTAYSVEVSGTTNPTWATPTANGQCFMSGASSFATTTPSFQTCPSGGVNITVNGGSNLGSPVNFESGSGVTVTNPSGNNVQFTNLVGTASNVTGQTASQTIVTLATAPTAGLYHVTYYADQNATCSGGATVSFTFNWTDATNARSLSTGNLTLSSAQQTSGYLSGSIPLWVGSGNVTYTSTFAGSASCSYDVHAALISN